MASSAKCGLALIMAAIAASSLATSTAIVFNSRACIFCTGSGPVLAPVLQLGLQVEQPLTRVHDLGELLTRRIVGLARGQTSRQTRRSSRHRSHRSWPAVR